MADWLKAIRDRLRTLRPKSRLPDLLHQYDAALLLVRSGCTTDALNLLSKAATQVRELAGEHSVAYGNALFTLAKLNVTLGDFDAAGRLCFQAAQIRPKTGDFTTTRLTYLMNAGELWLRSGRVSQAVELLTRGLADRIAYYGKDHEGVAYGQVALAQAMMAAGQYERGEFHAESARRIFAAKGHLALPSALALTAAFQSVHSGRVVEAFKGNETLSSAFLQQIIASCNAIAAIMPGNRGLEFLERVANWAVFEAVGDEVDVAGNTSLRRVRTNAVGYWANFAAQKGYIAATVRSSVLAAQVYRQHRDWIELIDELCRYASTVAQLPDSEHLARSVYAESRSVALSHGLFQQGARVLRDWAVFESEQRQISRANDLFDEATAAAIQGGDKEIYHRIHIARGIMLMHLGRREVAREHLSAGIPGLVRSHVDAVCGHIHLTAIESGLPCPCSESDTLTIEGLTQLSLNYFAACGLGDFVESVNWEKRDELQMTIKFHRPPIGDEAEILRVAFRELANLVRSGKPQVSEV